MSFYKNNNTAHRAPDPNAKQNRKYINLSLSICPVSSFFIWKYYFLHQKLDNWNENSKNVFFLRLSESPIAQ